MTATYIDHDGKKWLINQTVSELSQDLHADLVQAIGIARQLQAENDRLRQGIDGLGKERDAYAKQVASMFRQLCGAPS